MGLVLPAALTQHSLISLHVQNCAQNCAQNMVPNELKTIQVDNTESGFPQSIKVSNNFVKKARLRGRSC